MTSIASALRTRFGIACLAAALWAIAALGWAQMESLYTKPDHASTRWATFENPLGEKGKGAMENQGAKGHAFQTLAAGESRVLMDVQGSGTITRMWFTVNDRTTETLRRLKLEMFWDGAKTPAVSVPFGDFFGAILGRTTVYDNAFFASPEAKSFNCFIPMPFRKGAKVVFTNETDKELGLLFYDIDYLVGVNHGPDVLYFHAWWHRDNPTTLRQDFEILPKVKGPGRFLGTNIGVKLKMENLGWWGEGEVKMYVDGDDKFPTIVGTGTEDYIGTGWGQGAYIQRFQGCPVSDPERGQYTFYRYHVPDPVYFEKDIRVTIQQMGGDAKDKVLSMLKDGVPIAPVSAAWKDPAGREHFVKLLESKTPVKLESDDYPEKAWTNYYRRDDVSAVAYFYLASPENGLPPLAPAAERVAATR